MKLQFKRGSDATLKALLLPACLVAGVVGFMAGDDLVTLPVGTALKRSAESLPIAGKVAAPLPAEGDDCSIKGNISSSGERIYHLPGQRYYGKTAISPEKGERWFCSETEARAAGWRRSKV